MWMGDELDDFVGGVTGKGREGKTLVHLRFRGLISGRGWKGRVTVWGRRGFNYWTSKLMLAGLAEEWRGERSRGSRE